MDKHAAVYARISPRLRDTAAQEADLRRWAKDQAGPVKWYRDRSDGATLDRPGLERLVQDVRAGKVASVVVWRLDRLGRTARGLAALMGDLAAHKVKLVSVGDDLELAGPALRPMARVLEGVADYEAEERSERVMAGQKVARAEGRKWGGSRPGRRLKVTPQQEATILKQKAAGAKIAAIARETGLSRPTVYAILRTANPPAPKAAPKAKAAAKTKPKAKPGAKASRAKAGRS
jgi:DNA invertase Pin-like site-specific DNA recombinase